MSYTCQLKKRLVERLGDCVQFFRGSIIQRLCKQQAFKRRTSSSLRCQEGLLVLRLQQTMPQELSDHSSDTVMDVTDLADFDVYSELTTEGSSRLSTVEVFNTAMQLRGLVQSMKSSVPPVAHADDMLMYSHLSSSCTTSWSESCRVLAVLLVKSTPQRKLLPVMTHKQGNVCCPGLVLDLCNFPKAYTDAMQTCDMLHWH